MKRWPEIIDCLLDRRTAKNQLYLLHGIKPYLSHILYITFFPAHTPFSSSCFGSYRNRVLTVMWWGCPTNFKGSLTFLTEMVLPISRPTQDVVRQTPRPLTDPLGISVFNKLIVRRLQEIRIIHQLCVVWHGWGRTHETLPWELGDGNRKENYL